MPVSIREDEESGPSYATIGNREKWQVDNIGLLLAEIDDKKEQLKLMRPLTAGELSRLREESAVEYTYNSNAIEGNTMTLKETSLVLQGLTIAEKPLKEHLEIVGHKETGDKTGAVIQLGDSAGSLSGTDP